MIRLAIPTRGNKLSAHFGRADGFFLCDIEDRCARRPRVIPRPRSACESLPLWLKSMGVTVVLTRGVGAVANRNLADVGILVLSGARGDTPGELVSTYLGGWRDASGNTCRPHQPRHCKRPS